MSEAGAMIVVVDYGLGNLGSIVNMLKRVGAAASVSADPKKIQEATKLILPGIGAFDTGMKNLRERGIAPVLEEKVQDGKTPILGICLGMQLMTRRSDEGTESGLGFVDAETKALGPAARTAGLPVPHMGWNGVRLVRDSQLISRADGDPRFYFVHSYAVWCAVPEDVLGLTTYGQEFVAAFQRGHVVGVQFHPEKSHRYGMALLKNFVERF